MEKRPLNGCSCSLIIHCCAVAGDHRRRAVAASFRRRDDHESRVFSGQPADHRPSADTVRRLLSYSAPHRHRQDVASAAVSVVVLSNYVCSSWKDSVVLFV